MLHTVFDPIETPALIEAPLAFSYVHTAHVSQIHAHKNTAVKHSDLLLLLSLVFPFNIYVSLLMNLVCVYILSHVSVDIDLIRTANIILPPFQEK